MAVTAREEEMKYGSFQRVVFIYQHSTCVLSRLNRLYWFHLPWHSAQYKRSDQMLRIHIKSRNIDNIVLFFFTYWGFFYMIACLCFHIVWTFYRCKSKANLCVIHSKLYGTSECLGIIDNTRYSKCEYHIICLLIINRNKS